MAQVTSLTAARILELAAGWDGVSGEQSELRALIADLNVSLETNQAGLEELNSISLPNLRSDLADNAIALSDLNDTVIPDLNSSVEVAKILPRTFFSDVAPTDTAERALQVSDVWYDTAHGHKQYMWNGVEWATFQVDIPDLSLTVQKFKTSTHMIY